MSIRIRIPWGLLASVLGFAALGAATGYFLLSDSHGHLLERCVVHALGAALLGAAGWRLSERLTDFVNLHTAPMLRLALPGAAAVWLATEAVGVFTELAVGSGAWWPEAVAPLLLFAVGLVPLFAGITLLAGLETVLAARRGGGGAVDALRPIALYLVAAAFALAGIGYVGVTFPDSAARAAIALAPDRVRASGWSQREQRLFTAVHAQWSCEVLVVPVAGAPVSLDRAARSLITRLIAAQLALRSGLCVADPTLVARALGARARAVSDRAVSALADAMGARYVVHGEVRMDASQRAFDLVLRLRERADGRAPWRDAEDAVWGPLPFSDELPPEQAFARVAREAVDGLGIALEAEEAQPEPAEEAGQLPGSMAQLAGYGRTALVRARGLQLLAATQHPAQLDGEQLWERSVIALAAVPATDEPARVLRARAALHLGRRPYALQLLDGLSLPEAAALRALADGNLIEAERRAPELADVAALTLELELAALRARYGKPAASEARRQALFDNFPGYAALLYVPLSTALLPAEDAHGVIARQLSALGADAQPGRLAALAAKLGIEFPGRAASASLAADVERSRAGLWRAQAGAWRAERAFDRVAAWDITDALYAANRTAVTLRARALAATPGKEDALMAQVRALGAGFTGDIGMQAAQAVALARLGAGAGADAFLQAERSRRLRNEVVAWEGGEGDSERELRAQLESVPPAPADEPARAWRRAPLAEDDAVAVRTAALHYARMQAFAWDDFGALQRAIDLYERAGEGDRVAQLLEQARTRFAGDPARERYLLQRAEATRDLPAAVTLLQEHMREQPDQWATYPLLARAYLRAQEPAMAQRALLNYPSFNDAQASGAGAQAAEAGALLLMAGEGEFARPLLELAARPGETSSDPVPRLTARMALAQLDGNWPEARRLALELHEGHAAEHALAHAGTLAFLLGEPEAGWRAFYEASKRFETLAPWAAALDGHRLEGTKPDEVVAFTKRWKSLSGERTREARLKQQFLFSMFLVDRAPADWAVEALTGLAKENEDQAFAALVRGYAAFKRGDYALVVSELEPLQQRTELESIALPWLALALHQTGHSPKAQVIVQAAARQTEGAFDAMLGAAYLAGAVGEHERALRTLWDAFLVAPAELRASVPAGFQLLETCERLHALTGNERYRQLLLDLARRQQRAWPVSWAFAFEARYATHPDDVERALGAALFLDAQSEHLRGVPDNQRQRAAQRFDRGNPYRRS